MRILVRPILLFVILLGMWLLMSGHYTPLITSLGIISCALAAGMAHLMGRDRPGRAADTSICAAARLSCLAVPGNHLFKHRHGADHPQRQI
jgi:multisubunit Na+/H+ antiporter MnhE subunit